jgi:hypothetical protein
MMFHPFPKMRCAKRRLTHRSSPALRLENLEDRLVPSIADGSIILLDNPSTPSGPPTALVAVNPSTGAQSIVSQGQLFATPVNLREAPDRQIYVTDYTAYGPVSTTNVGGAVFRVDPDTGHQSLVAKGGYINGPSAIAVIQHNPVAPAEVYITNVGDDTGTYRNIIKIDPRTGAQQLVSSGGILYNPLAIVPGPGDNIYVLDEHAFGTGALDEINLASGHQRVISTGGLLRFPIDLAKDPSGDLIVFNRDSATDFTVGAGSVLRIDPNSGKQTLLSSNGDLTSLDGGTVARDGTIYAGTTTTVPPTVPAWIVAVNPRTGAQHIISEGGDLDIIEGMTVFYTNPGGGAAAPPAPSSFLVNHLLSNHIDPAQVSRSVLSTQSPVSLQARPVQLLSEPLSQSAAGKEFDWSLMPARMHQFATRSMVVDEVFAAWQTA